MSRRRRRKGEDIHYSLCRIVGAGDDFIAHWPQEELETFLQWARPDLVDEQLRQMAAHEAAVRILRKRIEALRRNAERRACRGPGCTAEVTGNRTDAHFCSTTCRVRAHRRERTDRQRPQAGV